MKLTELITSLSSSDSSVEIYVTQVDENFWIAEEIHSKIHYK
jgi:hypothetical protein